MDHLVPALLGLGGVLLVALLVLAVVHGVRQERRRVEALRAWAHAHQWRIVDSPQPVGWTSRVPGRNRRGVSRALVGVQQGHHVSVAEYRYTETTSTSNNSTSSTTHHFIVVVVHLDRPGATIAVQHRGALSKLGRSIFGDRATALGDERFDSRWRVSADDPTIVRGFLGPALVAEHIAGRVPHWSLQGTELVTYEHGRLTDPSRIPALVAPLLRVASLLGR
ncbi:hypothetical protein ACTMTJ_35130 [Phytohabitans sp. LJ34]|uniref:hypothetical protein n=1 Tax=Phytohabitans sp. LJ34 TaxID=3452217 RepID=UPI003F8C28C2